MLQTLKQQQLQLPALSLFSVSTAHTDTNKHTKCLPSSYARCGCQRTPQCVHDSCRLPRRSYHRPRPHTAGWHIWLWFPLKAGWSPGRRNYHLSAAAEGLENRKTKEDINSKISDFENHPVCRQVREKEWFECLSYSWNPAVSWIAIVTGKT